jgi:hypothetical protein
LPSLFGLEERNQFILQTVQWRVLGCPCKVSGLHYSSQVLLSACANRLWLQRQIKLDQVKTQIRVLYHLQPLCNLNNHRKWFYANPEEHFLREPLLTQLQNWVTTYEPMIRARIQHQLNQQGLTAIDEEAFEHANSLGPLATVTPLLPT